MAGGEVIWSHNQQPSASNQVRVYVPVGSIQLTFSAWLGIQYLHRSSKDLVQSVKNPPTMQETWVRSLGRENPLEKENSNPHQYSCLENSMDRAGRLQSMKSQRVGHD